MSKLRTNSYSHFLALCIVTITMSFAHAAPFTRPQHAKKLSPTATNTKTNDADWLTIIIHGTVGFQANACYKTILAAQADCIEGTPYERNVLAIRESTYLFALQPMQKIGFHKITDTHPDLNASYAFVSLYKEVQRACGIEEKSEYFTYGWSGLISAKRRYAEARTLYKIIREQIALNQKKGKKIKIRLIGYSHGATLLLNLADIRAREFPNDSFRIDETILIGVPVNLTAERQILNPIFNRIYNIFSRGDKVQRLDVFSSCDFFSSREFIGCLPDGLTQIEMKFTACLRKNPCHCLPSRMRGMYNQSPGHIELWFFGWAPSSYRQNLNMYPVPGAVFIPYLICAANKMCCTNLVVDIRPEQEILRVRSKTRNECTTMPFMNKTEYAAFLAKGMEFHPSNSKYKASFIRSQENIGAMAYK